MGRKQIVRIKFEISPITSKLLYTAINDLVRTKVSKVKPIPKGMRGDERKDFRIFFPKQVQVVLKLVSASNGASHGYKGILIDLSLCGACMALKAEQKIAQGTKGSLRLEFMNQPLSLSMVVLESVLNE